MSKTMSPDAWAELGKRRDTLEKARAALVEKRNAWRAGTVPVEQYAMKLGTA